MRKIKLIYLFLFVTISLFSQTTLSPTDIIMVTVNADGSDNFDFVPLADLETGTVIKFTDDAWNSSDAFEGGEGIITYTAPSPVSAGTVVSYSGADGGGFVASGSFNASGAGDNILVYQGTEASPAFIYGIGWASGSSWISSGAVSTNDSYIPSGLSEAEYTIVQLGTSDNYQYNTANGTSANAVDLQALMSDEANWNGNSSSAYSALGTSFTITTTNNLANTVVIAEVYPNGGNSGATYTHDYIILYNPTGSAVDISNYSIQYESSTGDWSSISSMNLTGSIAAGAYYVIQGSGGSEGVALPVTADVSGTMNMSGSGGKIALVSNQTNISGIGDGDVVDFLGYGSANEFEGTVMDDPTDNATSMRRKDNNGYKTMDSDGSGYDTDDNFFDFYLEDDITNNPPLPVELISFTATNNESSVNLSWATATEVNNFGFDVERSFGGSDFEKIGFVQGYGTTNSPKSYLFVDDDLPNTESISYRLKQIDNDGTTTYSKVVAVDLSSITSVDDDIEYQFTLEQNFPNPFNPSTTINFTVPRIASGAVQSVKTTLKVYDVLGKQVAALIEKNLQPGIHQVNFDASDLPSGMYFYKIEVGTQFSSTKKMILLK